MYKNFNLTEKEKKDILEQHGRYGYKKPLKEQDLDNKPLYGRVFFNNGGSRSIQANRNAYCEPRDDQGPYIEMELGYPSRGTKLTDSLLEYAERTPNYEGEDMEIFDPYDTVYAYVPVSVIKELINANGGIKRGQLPPMSDNTIGGIDRGQLPSMSDDDESGYMKSLNERLFNDEGSKFRISHAGVPVNKIMVSVELSGDYENDEVTFKLMSDGYGNITIVDFDNPSDGEIDDDEVREYMESVIASGKLNVPDFISFDPETGKADRY